MYRKAPPPPPPRLPRLPNAGWINDDGDDLDLGHKGARIKGKKRKTVYVLGATVILILVATLVGVILKDSIWPQSDERSHTHSNATNETEASAEYTWKWFDEEHSVYKKYEPDLSPNLCALAVGQNYTYSRGQHEYVIRKLSKTTAQQRNVHSGKIRSIKRFRKYTRVNLEENEYYHSEQYHKLSGDQIRDLFYNTTDRSQYNIYDIERVEVSGQNPKYEVALWTKCNDLGRERSKVEKYLWHGSDYDTTNSIIAKGFDRSYSKVAAYGKGTYFARDSRYSATQERYCPTDIDGYKYILLCKVIVGDSVKGEQSMQTIPSKADNNEYDAFVDNPENPSIYVTWRDYTAIPMYRLKFKRKS